MTTLPKGRVLKVEMELVIHGTVTEEDAQEYLEAELTQSGGYHVTNALCKAGFDVLNFELEDTGMFVSFDVRNVRRVGKSTHYSVSKPQSIDRRGPDEIEGWQTEEQVRRAAFEAAQ